MDQLQKIAKALSDHNRIQMLKLLTEKDICVCEMNEIFEVSHSQISRHLSQLADAGFLNKWNDGKCVVYMADRVNSNKYCQAIFNVLADSMNEDEQIIEYRKKLQEVIANKTRENKR